MWDRVGQFTQLLGEKSIPVTSMLGDLASIATNQLGNLSTAVTETVSNTASDVASWTSTKAAEFKKQLEKPLTEEEAKAQFKKATQANSSQRIEELLHHDWYPLLPVRQVPKDETSKPGEVAYSFLAFAESEPSYRSSFETIIRSDNSMIGCLLDRKITPADIERIVQYRPDLLLKDYSFWDMNASKKTTLTLLEFILLRTNDDVARGDRDVHLLKYTLQGYKNRKKHFCEFGAEHTRQTEEIIDAAYKGAKRKSSVIAGVLRRYANHSAKVTTVSSALTPPEPVPTSPNQSLRAEARDGGTSPVTEPSILPSTPAHSSSATSPRMIPVRPDGSDYSRPSLPASPPPASAPTSGKQQKTQSKPVRDRKEQAHTAEVAPRAEEKNKYLGFALTFSSWYITSKLRPSVWFSKGNKLESISSSAEMLYQAGQHIKNGKVNKASSDPAHSRATELLRHRRFSWYTYLERLGFPQRSLTASAEIVSLLASMPLPPPGIVETSNETLASVKTKSPQKDQEPLRNKFQRDVCLAYLKNRGTVWFSRGDKAQRIAEAKPEELQQAVRFMQDPTQEKPKDGQSAKAYDLAQALKSQRRWSWFSWGRISTCAAAVSKVAESSEYASLFAAKR